MQPQGSIFTLGEVAALGLPVGRYIVRLQDIEAGASSKEQPVLKFTAIVAMQPENPKVQVGAKQIWSVTLQEQYLRIIASDLIRCGLDPKTQLPKDATALARTLGPQLIGQFFIIQISEQKNDPTRMNTNFVGPYTANAMGGAPQAASAPPFIAPQPAGIPQPGMFPAGQPIPSGFNPAQLQGHQAIPTYQPQPQFAPAPAPVQTSGYAQQMPASAAPPQAPAPVGQIPQPAGIPQPAPGEPGLNAEIIQALQRGEQLQLNGTQIAQLQAMGMPTVMNTPPPQPSAQPFANPPVNQQPSGQPPFAAFNAV